MSAATGATGSETDIRIAVTLSATSGLTAQAGLNRDRMVAAYRAIEAGDYAALAALLDPDVGFFEAPSLPYGGAVRGIEATLRGVGGMMAAWSSIRVEIEEFAAAGDLVIAYMQFTGTSRRTGRTYEGACAEVFRFRDGRIVEWRPIYWDTHAARAACLE